MSPKESKRSVIGVVFNERKDKILLIKRCDVPIWVLPGGGVEESESPEEAVIREVNEETGLTVSIIRSVAVYTPVNRLANLTYVFECKIDKGILTTGEETRQLGLFSFNELPQPFFFVHQDWLLDAQKNQLSIIRKELSQVTYFALIRYFCSHPVHVLRFVFSRLGIPINSKKL